MIQPEILEIVSNRLPVLNTLFGEKHNPAFTPVSMILIDEATNQELKIPIIPGEVTVSWSRMTETVNILNLGEILVTTGDKLKTITFESYFPAFYDPSLCSVTEIYEPASAHVLLNEWQSRMKQPKLHDAIRFICTTVHDINMKVIIQNYEAIEKGGEPGDLYYRLTLSEFKEVQIRTEDEEKQKSKRSEETKKVEKKYLVKPLSNDDLFDKKIGTQEKVMYLAKQLTGKSSDWKRILSNSDQLKDYAGIVFTS